MRRELFIGRQNPLTDLLEVTANGGTTYTPVDLSGASEVRLQIYDDPSTPVLELLAVTTHSSQFLLGADGVATWTPGPSTLTAAMAGNHNLRWIVQPTSATGGEVIEAEPVAIRP